MNEIERDLQHHDARLDLTELRAAEGEPTEVDVGDMKTTKQGRPISVDFHSTPGLYVATFENYDGAPDSHHPVGLGRTAETAVADLIEQDEERNA